MSQPPQREVARDENGKPEWVARRATRSSTYDTQQRLKEIKQMMIAGLSDRDIWLHFKDKLGHTSKSFKNNYIARARRDFRKLAGTNPAEAKGCSLDFWKQRQRKYLAEESKLAAELAAEVKREGELTEKFDSADSAEELLAYGQELKRVHSRINGMQAELGKLRHHIHGMQDRTDRIFGNLAPLKIAETNADGTDKPRTAEQIHVHMQKVYGIELPGLPREQPRVIEMQGRELPQ